LKGRDRATFFRDFPRSAIREYSPVGQGFSRCHQDPLFNRRSESATACHIVVRRWDRASPLAFAGDADLERDARTMVGDKSVKLSVANQ